MSPCPYPAMITIIPRAPPMNLFMMVKSMLKGFCFFLNLHRDFYDGEKNCCLNNDGFFFYQNNGRRESNLSFSVYPFLIEINIRM